MRLKECALTIVKGDASRAMFLTQPLSQRVELEITLHVGDGEKGREETTYVLLSSPDDGGIRIGDLLDQLARAVNAGRSAGIVEVRSVVLKVPGNIVLVTEEEMVEAKAKDRGEKVVGGGYVQLTAPIASSIADHPGTDTTSALHSLPLTEMHSNWLPLTEERSTVQTPWDSPLYRSDAHVETLTAGESGVRADDDAAYITPYEKALQESPSYRMRRFYMARKEVMEEARRG